MGGVQGMSDWVCGWYPLSNRAATCAAFWASRISAIAIRDAVHGPHYAQQCLQLALIGQCRRGAVAFRP